MDESITAAEANRNFSRLLREVRDGRAFIVTSHGRPVARIIPADIERDRMLSAREKLFARLRKQPARGIERTWTREGLYERDS